MYKFTRSPLFVVLMSMVAFAALSVYAFDLFGLKQIVAGIVGTGGIALAFGPVVMPVPSNPELISAVVAYKNEDLIQDEAFPIVPVGNQVYKYNVYSKESAFTLTDTKVGRTSSPNKIEFAHTELSSNCVANGLYTPVPNSDIANAPPGYDPIVRAAVNTMDTVLLGREKNCADLLFNVNSYPAANKVALAGNDMFSDYTNSDPIKALGTILDNMVMRGNKMFIGQQVWSVLKCHPKVVSAILGNSGTQGVVTTQQLADKLELKSIHVGKAWYNSAGKGQTASLTRLWGNYIALGRYDAMASMQDRITFALTAMWGSRTSKTDYDSGIGLDGGYKVTSGMYTDEKILASDLGYLISNVVS